MGTIKYTVQVGTSNNLLRNVQVSRAYALLTPNVEEAKKYGFLYKFIDSKFCRVDDEKILGENIFNKRKGIDSCNAITAIDDNTKIAENTSIRTATNNIQSAIKHSIIDMSKYSISNCNTLKVNIANNKESICELTDKIYNCINLDSISEILNGVEFIADNLTSVCCKDDNIISASNYFQSQMYKFNSLKISANVKDNYSYIDKDIIITNISFDNISFITNSLMKSNNSNSIADIYNSIKSVEHNLNNAYINTNIFILDKNKKIITGNKNLLSKTSIKIEDKNILSFINLEMCKKLNSKEMYKSEVSILVNRYSKPAIKNFIKLYYKSEGNKMVYLSKQKLFIRTGKQNCYIDKTVYRYDRCCKLVFNGRRIEHILVSKFDRSTTIIISKLIFDKFRKVGYTNNPFVLSFINNRIGRITDSKTLMSRIPKELMITRGHLLYGKIFKESFVNKYMRFATIPEKVSVIRLFNTFNARLINKVIFAEKTLRSSSTFNNLIETTTNQRESIIIFDILEMVTDNHICEIQNKIITALSKGFESVVMIGLNAADNSESNANILISTINADNKEYANSIIDLIAVGQGKKAHDSVIENKIIDVDDNRISEALIRDILELGTRDNRIKNVENMDDLISMIRDDKKSGGSKDNAIELGVRPKRNSTTCNNEIRLSEWDTEWSQLANIVIESKDRFNKIKVPKDDYCFEQLYDKTSGVPYVPIGNTNESIVEIKFPTNHFNKYDTLYREEIPVSLYVYKDTMLLIWIFWCKHRTSERTLNILTEFYKTENIEMTRLEEYSKIVQMDAAQAINYVLDNVHKWIEETISYYDAESMVQYEKVMKQARWFGEKIANENCKYILVREYKDYIVNFNNALSRLVIKSLTISNDKITNNDTKSSIVIGNVNQYIDGEIIIEAVFKNNSTITVSLDNIVAFNYTGKGIYLENNTANSSYISEAFKIKLPMNTHGVKITLDGDIGDIEILNIKITNNIFVNATTKYESKPGTGTQAIDKLLSMMHEYYEIHHEHKAKGERDLWHSN